MNRFFLNSAGFLFAFTLITQVTFSQDPLIEWQNTIGGSQVDELWSMQQTSDGGYICGGNSWSNISADKSENSLGGHDYWVIKLDTLGNILWENTIGGSQHDYLNSISETNDGGFILGGTSWSGMGGDKTEGSMGMEDYWIVKIDNSGSVQWQNTIGGSSEDVLRTVFQTMDGGYLIAGTSWSGMGGDKTEGSVGMEDFWVVKVDSLGNIIWQNTIGSTWFDFIASAVQAPDGGYLIGGQSTSIIDGDKTVAGFGGLDYWILKLDATNGTIIWQKAYGGNNLDVLRNITKTNDGGFLLSGESDSDLVGDKTEPNYGINSTWDYWIVKIDSVGNILWQNTIGGDHNDILHSTSKTQSGGFVLSGYSISNASADKTEDNIGLKDYWIVNVDHTGNVLWENTIGGIEDDECKSAFQTTNGGYLIGGFSKSNISGDKTENSLGDSDYWVLKLKGDPNTVTGKVFVDLNTNNQYDTGEPGYFLGQVQSVQSGNNGFTVPGNNGIFYIAVDTGSWNTGFNPNHSSHATINPLVHTSNFGSQRIQTDTVDFAVQLIPGHPDLCITLIPLSIARPGFNATYRIIAKNVGTDTISGDVRFIHDSLLVLGSTSPIHSAYNYPELIWNFTGFTPLQTLVYDISYTVPAPPTVNINDTLNFSAIINPVATDEEPKNNFSFIEQQVFGSFDPNDKWVNREVIYSNELPYTEHLNYLIRFQNTGTDTAFTVRVRDTLDALLDQSTLNIIHASHDYLLTKRADNVLEFQFDNILLPDSNVNEPLSHGYIAYRIKPKNTFGVGDIISNLAAIYFDYNPPVLTNVVSTEAILFNSVNEIQNTVPLIVYPNPTNGKLTISAKGLSWKNAILKLYNTLGQLALEEHVNKANATNHTISVDKLSIGVYQLEVFTDDKRYSTKIIIE